MKAKRKAKTAKRRPPNVPARKSRKGKQKAARLRGVKREKDARDLAAMTRGQGDPDPSSEDVVEAVEQQVAEDDAALDEIEELPATAGSDEADDAISDALGMEDLEEGEERCQ